MFGLATIKRLNARKPDDDDVEKLKTSINYLDGYRRGRQELLRVVQFEIERLSEEISALEERLFDAQVAQRNRG